MNSRITRTALLGLIGVAAIWGLSLLSPNSTPIATAQQEIFLDWSEGGDNCWNMNDPWLPPPVCSNWHEITPAFCTDHHQDAFEDNGDGVVSICDYITLNGLRYHITSVGPTIYLDCSPGGAAGLMIMEPVSDYLQDPTQTQWVEIYPEYGGYIGYMTAWNDNGDSVLSPCDQVEIGGMICHVKRVGCNIRVTPSPNAVETTTWGQLKALFGF